MTKGAINTCHTFISPVISIPPQLLLKPPLLCQICLYGLSRSPSPIATVIHWELQEKLPKEKLVNVIWQNLALCKLNAPLSLWNTPTELSELRAAFQFYGGALFSSSTSEKTRPEYRSKNGKEGLQPSPILATHISYSYGGRQFSVQTRDHLHILNRWFFGSFGTCS